MGPEVCHVRVLEQKDNAQNILGLQFQPKRKINMSELQKIDTVIGDGKEATAGNHVDVHYTGWLFDEKASDHKGQKFDSSLDRGQLFSFPLGAGHVIKGWDQGVQGMKIGGKRTLIIPSEMGYGARGAGGVIPPNATLVFDVELHGVN
jgi:FKBP-type peptidyl-prolyl cis-trans isomerase FkpA